LKGANQQLDINGALHVPQYPLHGTFIVPSENLAGEQWTPLAYRSSLKTLESWNS